MYNDNPMFLDLRLRFWTNALGKGSKIFSLETYCELFIPIAIESDTL